MYDIEAPVPRHRILPMGKGTHMRVTKKLLLGSVVVTAALALAACAPTAETPSGAATDGGGPAEVTVGIAAGVDGYVAQIRALRPKS